MVCWNYYTIYCGLFGLYLFIYGFFLLNNYSKNTCSNCLSKNFSVEQNIKLNKSNEKSNTLIHKVVIMIIDALRLDFVVENSFLHHMQFLNSSISNGKTCVFPCRVPLPTVTMPRIKTITTGAVSSFIDIVLNFGNQQLSQENILQHIVHNRQKIIFYGDDTWIKLFPNTFHRFEGTTSFFVSDFFEVDNNVTRNVHKEIIRDDWDMMILHYLGLDHIGHVEGSISTKIPQKLGEMDKIIELLNQHLHDMYKKYGRKYLIIVCGDHGMKDSGGHGGSSFAEVVTPFITFGLPCKVDREIFQTDIAVTLATLLQLPIPRYSVGKLISGLIDFLPLETQLEAYYNNMEQLLKISTDLVKNSTVQSLKNRLNKALKSQYNNNTLKELIVDYQLLLSRLNSQLIHSLTRFDILSLYMAIILMLQVCFLSSSAHGMNVNVKDIVYAVFITLLFLIVLHIHCSFEQESLLCDYNFSATLKKFLLTVTISFNLVLLFNVKNILLDELKNAYQALKHDLILTFLVAGTCMQIISYLSTSFIEEEHLLWYFLWITFVVLQFRNSLLNCTQDIGPLTVLMISHRIIMKLNQTGDKWAKLPAFSDWLKLPQHKMYLSVFTVIGLVLILISFSLFENTRIKSEHKLNRAFPHILHFICLFFVYLYKAAVKDILLPDTWLSHRGIFEFQIYLSILMMVAVFSLVNNIFFTSKPNRKLLICITETLIKIWILFVSILLRAYNVILLGSFLIVADSLSKILQGKENQLIKTAILHYWLARLFFFYQGNSNSIASIDVAAGYIGQTQYNIFIAGFFIFCNTYAFPILSYLFFFNKLHDITEEKYRNEKWYNFNIKAQLSINIFISIASLQITFFMIVLLMHRYHLFIWSVFSPKLLYLSVCSVLVYVFAVILQLSFQYFLSYMPHRILEK